MGQESVKSWIHIADDWTTDEQKEMLVYLTEKLSKSKIQ